jgi:hypothetical protein
MILRGPWFPQLIALVVRPARHHTPPAKIPSLDRKATAEGRQYDTTVGRKAAESKPKRSLSVPM